MAVIIPVPSPCLSVQMSEINVKSLEHKGREALDNPKRAGNAWRISRAPKQMSQDWEGCANNTRLPAPRPPAPAPAHPQSSPSHLHKEAYHSCLQESEAVSWDSVTLWTRVLISPTELAIFLVQHCTWIFPVYLFSWLSVNQNYHQQPSSHIGTRGFCVCKQHRKKGSEIWLTGPQGSEANDERQDSQQTEAWDTGTWPNHGGLLGSMTVWWEEVTSLVGRRVYNTDVIYQWWRRSPSQWKIFPYTLSAVCT